MKLEAEARAEAERLLSQAEADICDARILLKAGRSKANAQRVFRLLSGVAAHVEIVKLSIRRD